MKINYYKFFIFSFFFMFPDTIVFGQEIAGDVQRPDLKTITIDQAVEKGLRCNLDLLANQYNVSLAQADEITASLWYNPSLGVDTGLQPFGKNWNQTNAGGPRQYDANVSYPIDFTGKKIKGGRSAREATKIARAQLKDVTRLKIQEIRLAYIDTMQAKEILSLSQEKETNLQRLVDLLRSRIGDKDILPLLQTRAQLSLDQTRLETRQKAVALESAKKTLGLLLGYDVSMPIELGTQLRDFKISDLPNEESLGRNAIENRPDIEILKLSQSKAKLDKSLAIAQRWDNINFQTGYTSQGPVDANPDDPGSSPLKRSNDWSVGLSIPLPLFDQNQGNIRKAEVALNQIGKQIAAKELSIKQEVSSLYDQLKLTQELIKQYESSQLKNAQIVRDAQQKLYSTGAYALLEYLDAIGAYDDTLAAYYQALSDYRRNIARLNAAIGKDVL